MEKVFKGGNYGVPEASQPVKREAPKTNETKAEKPAGVGKERTAEGQLEAQVKEVKAKKETLKAEIAASLPLMDAESHEEMVNGALALLEPGEVAKTKPEELRALAQELLKQYNGQQEMQAEMRKIANERADEHESAKQA